REMTPRKAAEWPYQLHAAESWERLEACLTDIRLFFALYNDKTQWELTSYWHPLRVRDRDMGACYSKAFASWTAHPRIARNHRLPAQLGAFLVDNGLYSTAEPLLERALEASERLLGPEHPDTLGSMNNLAELLTCTGDYVNAEPLFRRTLEASERVLGSEHPSTLTILSNTAGLH
ncbi:MAG: tetratricopeptide repeat protein, partial [Planctomycetaceae bacterium]|nr:tetratricopeptide repeat protein [Planctomycetaceae bacterium]